MEWLTVAVAALTIAFILLWRWAEEDDTDPDELRWKPGLIDPLMLPMILLVDGVLIGVLKGWAGLESWLVSVCFNMTLLLTAYDALICILLPFLRKHFHARTCAVLWLLPNFLYVTEYTWVRHPWPKIIIHLQEKVLLVILAVWLLGALGIFLWKMMQHFCFRRQILKGSYPVSAQKTLEMWKEMQLASGLRKARYRLLIAPETKTPLTVGISRFSARVLLPEKEYTEEELTLILRHELVHIRRSDLSAKLFYVFTKSIGWFHPLVWLSLRRSADDLELSCDEAVLLGESEETRRTYAELLLRTAGDERGLTSCLSANAKALKHRLTGVMLPKKKHSGWWLIGVCIFALLTVRSVAAVSYGETTVGELLGENAKITSTTSYVGEFRFTGEFLTEKTMSDPRLTEALFSLRAERLGGNYSQSDKGRTLILIARLDGVTGGITVTENGISIARSLGSSDREFWYLPEGADALFQIYDELRSAYRIVPCPPFRSTAAVPIRARMA